MTARILTPPPPTVSPPPSETFQQKPQADPLPNGSSYVFIQGMLTQMKLSLLQSPLSPEGERGIMSAGSYNLYFLPPKRPVHTTSSVTALRSTLFNEEQEDHTRLRTQVLDTA